VDGLKTGFTNAAGFNLAASAMRNGHRLIAVVMGSSSGAVRNAHVENLLLTGFDIEDRRDRGERILATQDYFVGGGSIRVNRGAETGPRDAEGDPIDVVLTRTTAQPAALNVSGVMPARPVAAPSKAARDWWVQVGEFKTRKAAQSQIAAISKRFGALLHGAAPQVDSDHRTFRARFNGLTETAARDTCSTVRNRGVPCLASDRA
jgi:D-alanyl-D-alanine carboxypeptidase (penicillin-binding protein 5/6)